MTTSANPYDLTPYQSFAYPETHPNRLAVLASLFGRSPAPLAGCRVLEIGCAGGGNLLPMAAALPQAQFVGLDYSQVQIDAATHAAQALGLTNIRFVCEDMRSVDATSLGEFDYVIAHGIYSWLPADAQAAMLTLCRHCLAEAGVACVSYNTLPGWHMRGMVRDLMLFHAASFGDGPPDVAQAKALLDFMATHVPEENNPYGQYLRSELKNLSGLNASYLAHDHLEKHNEPLYFRDFIARAQGADLDYLGEAEFFTMLGSDLAAGAKSQLTAEIKDIVRLEQYFDFMRNRSFRMSLLVRRGSLVERNVGPERLKSLWVSSTLRPTLSVWATIPSLAEATPALCSTTPVRFETLTGQQLTTANPVTKAALMLLAEAAPASLAFGDLLKAARERLPVSHRVTIALDQDEFTLGADMLIAYGAGALVQLYAASNRVAPESVVHESTTDLSAPAYARWQARQSGELTNLNHMRVSVDEPCRQTVLLLDGSLDRAGLHAAFYQLIVAGTLVLQEEGKAFVPAPDAPVVGQALEAVLNTLAANALICAP